MNEFKSAGSVKNDAGRWNPYLVGAGLGVLSWLVFAVVNTPLGISTPISSAASLCAIPAMGGEAVARNAYWAKFPFQWDYHMLFLVGTFLGSLASVLAVQGAITNRSATCPSPTCSTCASPPHKSASV